MSCCKWSSGTVDSFRQYSSVATITGDSWGPLCFGELRASASSAIPAEDPSISARQGRAVERYITSVLELPIESVQRLARCDNTKEEREHIKNDQDGGFIRNCLQERVSNGGGQVVLGAVLTTLCEL